MFRESTQKIDQMKGLFSGGLFKTGPGTLHASVLSGDLQQVQQAVQKGVDVDAKDKVGQAICVSGKLRAVARSCMIP